jgi:hypothetical protein
LRRLRSAPSYSIRIAADCIIIFEFVTAALDAHVVHPPEEGDHFAPGYYSLLFEDPDGIRVEVNFIPAKGHFGEGGRLGPDGAGPASSYGSDGLAG